MYNNMQGQAWGHPPQPGFQQPQMTGYPQQQQQQHQQQQSGFMQPQPTGYPGMSQFQRPMQTGFPLNLQQQQHQQQQHQLAPQATGMGMGMGGMGSMGMGMGAGGGNMLGPGGSGQLHPPGGQRFLSPSPGGLQPQATGYMSAGSLQPQATGYMSAGSLQPQPTGYMGGSGLSPGLMPQMTGMPIRDPRLQLMSTQFLPASTPFSGAPVASNMNFSQASMQPSNFQTQIQNLSQQQQGSTQPKIPWALSKEEKKSYDSIFRAWDAQGTGFISGDVSREVFGQSGLEREKLMQIWHLADTENRGKLNINEFHVAMGLIYRAFNGNDIPAILPAELVPPSSRDLNESVDFLKDLLKKDTNVRNSTGLNIPEAGSNSGISYAKSRSFHENPVAPKKDASAYKHDDTDVASYKSSGRHFDRKAVRYEGQNATDDLSEMKRQLENTQKMLDKQSLDDDEDRELESEMDDLRYRIRRVQDDIEYYNRRGGRDSADLRRKAERELMHLMHERLPQLEKRIEAKGRREKDRKLDQSRDRDRRNDAYRRYESDRDDRDRDSTRLGDGEYLRGTFDRSRDDDRSSHHDDKSRERHDSRYDSRGSRDGHGGGRDDRDRDRDYERDRPLDRDSERSQTPVPPAPSASNPEVIKRAPPQASVPTPASDPTKNMTPEERSAWIRSEAQRRVQERMRLLGAVAPVSSPTSVDPSVEERLKAEKAEAEAKAAQADREAAAREEARRARLEEYRTTSQSQPQPQPAKQPETSKVPQPPPPRAPAAQPAKPEVNEEEEMIQRREEVLAKEKAEREARLKRLEEQEEEARRQEETFKERQGMFANKAKAAVAPVAPPSRKPKGGPPPPPPSRKREVPAPSAPPVAPVANETAEMATQLAAPPPASQSTPSGGGASTNPFFRMQQGNSALPAAPSSASVPPATPGGTNPFFRQQQAPASGDKSATSTSNLPVPARATPPVSAQPTGIAPSAPFGPIHVAPKHHDDDWEVSDKDEDDDDDDKFGSSTRATRQNLAQALFSNLIPAGRSTPPVSSPAPPAPAAQGTVAAPPPPPPPALAPAAPSSGAPMLSSPSGGPVDRGALLGQIQLGRKLKRTQTNDRSTAQEAGAVIGDATPPVQKYVAPPSPPAQVEVAAPEAAPVAVVTENGGHLSSNLNRQSVDWANHLAADQMNFQPFSPEQPSLREEDEDSLNEEGPENADAVRKPVPQFSVPEPTDHATDVPIDKPTAGVANEDGLEDIDLGTTHRVRAIYAYSGQRDEDLTFDENDIFNAHPSKNESGDWWYGTLIDGSKKGFFPRTYTETIAQTSRARALYDYTGASPEEATFHEGDVLVVVDQGDANWWRVDVGSDKILIVPATYLELMASDQGRDTFPTTHFPRQPQPSESDTESAVLVRALSSDCEAMKEEAADDPHQVSAPRGEDWVVIDESGASAVAGSTSADIGIVPPSTENEDEEVNMLQQAIIESQVEEKRALERAAQEEEDLKQALELSKRESTIFVTQGDESVDHDEESTTGWTSSDDDDDDDDDGNGHGDDEDLAPKTDEEIRMQAVERLRVLEAAGILIKTEPEPLESSLAGLSEGEKKRRPPPPPGVKKMDELLLLGRSKSSKGKKPKPERPARVKKRPERDLPSIPIPYQGKSEEDAYDRYLKMTKEVSLQPIPLSPVLSPRMSNEKRRQSLSSMVAVPGSPPAFGSPGSPALRPPSAQGESKTSSFLQSIKNMSNRTVSSRPVISGPIARPDSEQGQYRMISQPFAEDSEKQTSTGPSWSSLIGSSVSSVPPVERKRQEAIFELISTETGYVRDLQILVEVFFNSMQSLLSEKASSVIFANIESILFTAVSFLSDLENRQRECRLYISSIGDILLRHMPNMQVYLAFCVNQAAATETLAEERARDVRINNHLLHLRHNHPAARGLDLLSFLLIPMQRLARYPLLIAQVEKYTPADHPDQHLLAETKTMVERLLTSTNEAIRARESKHLLAQLSTNLYIGSEARLDLTTPTRFQTDRIVLKDEMLAKLKSGRKIRLILTNDLILLLQYNGQLYRMPIPLDEVEVKQVEGKKNWKREAFQLVHLDHHGSLVNDRIKLKCGSVKVAQNWIQEIVKAKRECVDAMIKANKKQDT